MNNKIIQCGGHIWHFYHSAPGICANITSRPGSAPAVIFPGGYFDFDVVCDSEDTIHLICQDKEGSVIYLTYKDGQWRKHTLLISKTKAAYIKSFKIAVSGRLVYAFYTIVKSSKPMLIFQYLNAEAAPAVIDYITPAPRSFFTLTDANGDIYVYYQNADSYLGFKRYIWSKKDFSAFTSLHHGASCPFAVSKDAVAAVYENKIIYISGGNATEIYNSFGNELSPPACFTKNNTTYVMWQQGNLLFNSRESGDGFTPAARLLTPYSPPELFEIKTASSGCSYLYGSNRNSGISLISPAEPVSVRDFFKPRSENRTEAAQKPKRDEDTLRRILEKLAEIENELTALLS